MSSSPYLSLILPAYNEARSIRATLTDVRAYLDRQPFASEVIVAADGDDGTREIVAELARGDARLRVIGSPRRGGKGRGIRDAVARSKGRVIGFADADNKTPIAELEKMLPWLDRGYDLVIGSRGTADARVENPQKFYRRAGSHLFKVALRLVVGLWGVCDTQCGFKFFRGPVARDLFARMRVDGYMFDVDILYLANRSGYRIKEVGVRWRDDGDSRLALVRGNWQNLVDLFRIRFGKVSPPPAVRPGAGRQEAA